MTRPRLALAAVLTVVAVIAAGCGGDDDVTPAKVELVVSAASSLKRPFGEYAGSFGDASVRTSFAGSDELAAQIENGVRPDVFAAANTSLPDTLFAKSLVERPVVFAVSRLVIAVSADAEEIDSIADLGIPGVRLAIGSPSVPVGAYTREVLAELSAVERRAIESNVRSNEPDVKGILGKLSAGAVDAGFVYETDVEASGGQLRAIELPARVRPTVSYAAAVVSGARHPRLAREFVEGLLTGAGRDALAKAGFEPPPS